MSTATAPVRTGHAPIPMMRLVGVEIRKMFDTRSGFWLMVSTGILSVLAALAVVAFGGDGSQTYESYGTAIGVPMAILLPVMAILSVTSEWSQRTGLTSFTLVPHRGKVIGAKALATLVVGVAAMVIAMAVGALGTLIGAAVHGVDPEWNISAIQVLGIIVANVVGMFMGFMLGLLIRNSPGAIVGYFVYSFVIPTILGMLYALQEWYRDISGWVDFQMNSTMLFAMDQMSGKDWAQLGVTSVIWLFAPIALGLYFTLRSEVK